MWKFLLIFLLTALIVQYLYRDKNSAVTKSDTVKRKKPTQETVPPRAPRDKKQRGEIFEPNGYITQYGITYYDVHEEDSDYDYLSSQGYQGGGPSWEGIIYGV